jgi:hypothetical protein
MAVDVSEVGSVKTVDLRHLLALRTMASRRGRWLTAAGLLAVLLSAFWAAGIFAPGVQQAEAGSAGAAVFFSVIIAYIVPIFAWISERTVAALDDLRRFWLGADNTQFQRWREQVYRKPLAWLACRARHRPDQRHYPQPAAVRIGGAPAHRWTGRFVLRGVAVGAGTMLVWLVMTLRSPRCSTTPCCSAGWRAAAASICCRPTPCGPSRGSPCCRRWPSSAPPRSFPSCSSTTIWSPLAYVPGLLATGIPMLLLAGMPIWPLHRRIADAKAACLHDLNARMAALPPPDVDRPETLATSRRYWPTGARSFRSPSGPSTSARWRGSASI